MQPPNTCPKCGAPLPPGTPKGQCPACLLALAKEPLESPEAATPESRSASRQFGDYLLGRQLGGGGMGVVYEAVQQSLNRKVALKLIRDWLNASPVLLRRFQIEAEAAARLNHPNIVPIFEVGEVEGQPYLAMGLVEGESLAQKLANGEFGVPRPADAVSRSQWRQRQTAVAKLMLKLAQAIHHAHQRGVLHRDLKPANILLDAAGEPHVTDFGLAKLLGDNPELAKSVTGPDDLLGTLEYMPPEQATNAGTSVAADIYGLGAVMYALLTGRPPFTGKTVYEILNQVALELPARPRALNPLAHVDLETICLRCLEKNPQHRYASAEALALDLRLWLEGRPILSRPVGPLRRTGQWARRNPVGAALIVSLAVGLAVSLGLWHQVKERERSLALENARLVKEGVDKLDDLWLNPATTEVTLTAEHLRALLKRPLQEAAATHEFTLGLRSGLKPSKTARKYADRLDLLATALRRELGTPVAFSLKLLKPGGQAEELLARGVPDLMVMSGAEYLPLAEKFPGLVPLAAESNTPCQFFVRVDAGLQRLDQLRRKSLALPHPSSSLSLEAKALLAEAGVFKHDLAAFTNFVDHGPEAGWIEDSQSETLLHVYQRQYAAGATTRKELRTSPYRQLTALSAFEAPGNLYVARAAENAEDRKLHRAFQKAATRSLGLRLVNENYLNYLRERLNKARRFDGEETASGNRPGPADNR